jgi:3-phenylpropionate/trans-cinnamate dioxygenase ferredoxin reductase subunit
MPSFWSDQYGIRLQSFGMPALGRDDARVIEGDLAGEVAVGYHRDGVLVGVVLLGLGSSLMRYRDLVADASRGAQRPVGSRRRSYARAENVPDPE